MGQAETDIDRALQPGVPGSEQMNLTREVESSGFYATRSHLTLIKGCVPGGVT